MSTSSTTSRCRNELITGTAIRQTRIAAALAPHSSHQNQVATGRCGEIGAGPQLMWQGQSDAEVGVQVDQMPGLVPQTAAGRAIEVTTTATTTTATSATGAGRGQQQSPDSR